ncbi:MAG TPA: hypothetical protein VLF18_11650 [Tahibacter sp.]|uniref:hypothetical protein n=1 Tax=Tahibacter sp. TaxID=2056211 RepID=UPI002C3381A2|nr:hypothetical protein [Tahibacter sp.]HSX60845.1 hypothetical protein [Tahibacter sp.]
MRRQCRAASARDDITAASIARRVSAISLQRIIVYNAAFRPCRPDGTGTPSLIWMAIDPVETATVTWDDNGGLFASTPEPQRGTTLALTATVPTPRSIRSCRSYLRPTREWRHSVGRLRDPEPGTGSAAVVRPDAHGPGMAAVAYGSGTGIEDVGELNTRVVFDDDLTTRPSPAIRSAACSCRCRRGRRKTFPRRSSTGPNRCSTDCR